MRKYTHSAREAMHIDRMLAEDNRRWPRKLVEVEYGAWPEEVRGHPRPPQRVLRSRDFFVQVFAETYWDNDGERRRAARLSICRTRIDGQGNWKEGITWDELQRLKAEAGYGEYQAVEIFPPDRALVNVSNMRHLWILGRPLSLSLT
ncbi:MAG TPA: hypothetical protein VK973_05920 [Arenicellales bacterium]|nr:hypothetical protein [Arenicellales bacterium]